MTPTPPREAAERRELAAALRTLRQAQKLSTTALAGRLGWSQSRVSRIDRGATLPTPDDVAQWCTATHATPETRRQLMSMAEHSAVELTEWRRELAPGRRRVQEEIARLEGAASVIRVFGADVVPGLAQTRAYAARMFQLGRPDVPDEADALDAVVDARMARQAVLGSSTQIRLLMSEMALRRHLVSGADLRDQIHRLDTLAQRPNLHVGVIPFAVDEVAHQYHGYAVLGDPTVDEAAVVLVETLTRALRVRDPGEVGHYITHYERLDSTAVHGDELREFLREVAAHVTWP